jgi:hypothetical protein
MLLMNIRSYTFVQARKVAAIFKRINPKGSRKNNHSLDVVVATLPGTPTPCDSLRGNRQPQY